MIVAFRDINLNKGGFSRDSMVRKRKRPHYSPFKGVGLLENQRREISPDAMERSRYRGFKRRGTIAERIVEGSVEPDHKYISMLSGQKKVCDKNSIRYGIISVALELCDGTLRRSERESVYKTIFE